MSLEDILIALRAADEGAIDREALSRLLAIIDTWDRGGLHPSAGELLTKQFRIDASKVRRWESEITGQAQRRIGRYQLRRKVGQGGMGLVFEALDPNLGRTVALKLLSGDRLDSPVSVQRFLREAKSSGSFNHPNIVHAFDAGIDGDLPYLVMEFVDGENLYQVLKRRGRIPPAEGLDWFIQAARGLEVLERQRWVHGDVKPSNFIITRSGVVKLADLGLCGPPGQPRPGVSPHGTPPYIAPEVLAGEYIDHRADLYSLGATIYHLIAGRPPRTSRSIEELREEMAEPLVPLATLCPDVSPRLSRVVMRLLEPAPKNRLAGGVALLRSLERLVPAGADDPAAETETDRPIAAEVEGDARPRKRVWVALGVSVIAIGVAIGLLAGPGGDRRGRTADEGSGAVASGGPGTTTQEGASDSSGNSEATRAGATPWATRKEEAAGDYAQLFAWLAGEGAAHPEVETWRAELTAELSEVVAPHWGTLIHELESLRIQGRYHEALSHLDSFPEKWRAGPYLVAWQEAVMNVRGERTAHLARLLLALESESGSLGALEVWRSLSLETPEDSLWFRVRIESELGGLPFLDAAHAAVTELASERARRREEFPRALLEGKLPAAQLHPLTAESLLDEAVLHWLGEHPQVAGTAGALLPRLFEARALGSIDPVLLSHLLGRVGERGEAVSEVEAAQVVDRSEAACRAFDLSGAEAAWRALADPLFAETIAAERVLPTVPATRRELEQAAFLRSDAFVCEVRGGWRQPTRFLWSVADPRFDEEWRFDSARFPIDGEGRRARGRGDRQLLSLAIPFTETCTFTLSFEPPEDEWTFLFGRGDNVLGFSGQGTGGNCRVIAGERSSVDQILGRGKGAPTSLPVDPDRPGRFTVRVRYLDGRWELDGGLAFSVAPVPAPAWLFLEVPTGAWIGSFSLSATVVEPWLIARKAHIAGD